jgi:hypothetical protein
MEITSVKLQQEGYLVNGNMFVPNVDSNVEYQFVQQWISEGNQPEAEFTEAQTQAKLNIEAKAYLESTDWYVVRWQETGAAVPTDITAARASARAAVL